MTHLSNIVTLAALTLAGLLVPAPATAQVPGETQNVVWCSGSKTCLQWSSTAGAGQYNVYRGEQASMPCLVGAPLDSCVESSFPTPTTGAGAIPELPAPGRFYWFIVTAQNGTGEGPNGSVKLGPTTQPRARNTFGSCPANCTAAPGSCLGANDCCSSNCAGSCQTACCTPAGGLCSQPSECCSSLCIASICQPCLQLGQSCASSASCCSGNCNGTCVPACAPNGDQCTGNNQCCSGTCSLGLCQPGCTQAGGNCAISSQCCSGVCQFSMCQQPTCNDVVQNGSETGIDCGGGTCPACPNGQGCNVATDCVSQNCVGGVCQCVPPGGACVGGSQCCSGICSGNVCQAICGDGVVSGTEQCDDANNVSGDGCSSSCLGEPGYSCTGSPSVCTPCPVNTANCNGNGQDGCEVQTSTNANNCGACNNVCILPNGTPACVNSQCTIGSCSPGYFDCNGQFADGCEVNVTGNVNNCGGCNQACNTANGTPACVNSQCTIGSCNPGFFDCNGQPNDGCEVNVTNNVNNCGSCNNVCTTQNGTPACVNSQCTVGSCTPPYLNCNAQSIDGCEINSAASPSNCGGCGMTCSPNHIPTPTCAAGVCNGACATGFQDCNSDKRTDGCETQLGTNSNCAFCGNACVVGAFCIGGTCQ